MRYLAIDLGERRTGLATGDDETGFATPYDVITTGSDAQRLAELVKVIGREEPDAVVVGLPLNMDGTEGPGAKRARALGAAIAQRCGVTVHFADERLSSAAADDQMARTGLTHGQKKARRDALAAAAILRGFLAMRGKHP